jgi:hypothetical protein
MFVRQLLLLTAVALLLGAGTRAAGRLSPAPLERLVAGAVLAASVAVIEALALGLLRLGTNPAALVLAAAATWLVARVLIAPAQTPLSRQLLDDWARLGSIARFGVGALAGAGVAWSVWLLQNPGFDWDNLAYHVPEVVAWVHNGRPGSIVPILPGFPYGNLPVTNEVLLSWGSGIARSFVWITIWPMLMVGLLAVSGWVGLRALRIEPGIAAAAVASLCVAPMLTSFQGNGANSDLPAVVWMVVAASLCAAATLPGRAGLLTPALLAGALAIGTKTTVAPLTVVAIGLAVYRLRGELRPLRGALLLCGCGALAVGGIWYLRDLIEHGSPLWPYYRAPWGDPLPHLQQPDITFFQRPLASLRRFGETGYVTDTFLGGLLVLAGALIAPALARTRAVVAGALATAVSVFLWTFAPDTGAPYPSFPATDAFHGSLRFLIPSAAVATLTMALAARDGGRRARLLIVVLAIALALNVVQLFGLGFPKAPTVGTPLLGAIVGGALFLLARQRPWRRIPRALIVVLGGSAVAAALAVGAQGFVNRAARVGGGYADLVRWFATAGNNGRTVYTAPVQLVLLTQDDLSRNVVALARTEPCQRVEGRAREGWVVVVKIATEAMLGPSTTDACVARWRPVFEGPLYVVYDARSLEAHRVATRTGASRRATRRPRTTAAPVNAAHAAIIGTV